MPHRRLELRERETVKPLELFFDLVFVLGFTQCAPVTVGTGKPACPTSLRLDLELVDEHRSGTARSTCVRVLH